MLMTKSERKRYLDHVLQSGGDEAIFDRYQELIGGFCITPGTLASSLIPEIVKLEFPPELIGTQERGLTGPTKPETRRDVPSLAFTRSY